MKIRQCKTRKPAQTDDKKRSSVPHFLWVFLLAGCAVAASNDSPSGTRITPPTISVVSPQGVARGATVEMTIEGFNLARASAIHFGQPAITATSPPLTTAPH